VRLFQFLGKKFSFVNKIQVYILSPFESLERFCANLCLHLPIDIKQLEIQGMNFHKIWLVAFIKKIYIHLNFHSGLIVLSTISHSDLQAFWS